MLKQFGWIAVGRVAAAALQFFTVTTVAEAIGPKDFGLLAAILGLLLVAQTIFDLGNTIFILKHQAQNETAKVRAALRLGLWSAAVMAVVLLLCSVVCALFLPAPIGLVAVLLCLWAASERATDLLLAVPTGAGNSVPTTISLVARRATVLIAVLVVGGAPDRVLVVYAVASVAGSVCAFGAQLAWTARQGFLQRSTESFSRIFAVSRDYWANSLAVQLRNADVFLVALGAGAVQGGFYGLASRVTTPLRIIPTSFATALLPHASSRRSRSFRDMRKPFMLVTVISAAVFLAAAALFPLVTDVMLGPEYDGAVRPVQVVCIGLIAASMVSQLNSLCIAWDLAPQVARSSWAATAYCLLLIVPVSWKFGAMGAACVLATSYVVNLTLLAYYYRQSKKREDSDADNVYEHLRTGG